jgi:hypothetical protein
LRLRAGEALCPEDTRRNVIRRYEKGEICDE